MVSFYEDVIDDALESHSVLRVIAGTSWIEDISVEAFMEYEGRVNALFEARDAMGLCHYDRTRVVVVADGFHPGGRPTTWVGLSVGYRHFGAPGFRAEGAAWLHRNGALRRPGPCRDRRHR